MQNQITSEQAKQWMLIIDFSSHKSSKKLIISTHEGKLGWREDQERIFHF